MVNNLKDQAIVLEVNNLKKQYGDLLAVSNLSMQVYKGEVFGFLGPNGAGKTTSINMLCGLLKPTDGDVFILGHKLTGNEYNKIKSRVGVCPQNIIVWPKLTCLEQLTFLGEMYGISHKTSISRAINLLDRMGLSEKKDKLAQTLSGGMQRRLNICLALIHDPEILVLDEPEAGLDPQSKVMVRDFIKEIANDKTIILTTHNMDEAERLADRVAIIDHGKLLLVNTPDELRKTIGEGDILEIKLLSTNKEIINNAIAELKELVENIKASDNILLLKEKNLIGLIPDISIKLKNVNIKIGEMKMRENTLEDVFIHLTGRSLRE